MPSIPFVYSYPPFRRLADGINDIVSSGSLKRLIFFDRNGATTVLPDRSGNDGNATISQQASALDPNFQGKLRTLQFNDTDEYWELEDSDDLSFGDGSSDSPMSIIAFINPNSVTDDIIVGKFDETTGVTQKEYLFQFSADNLLFKLYDDSANTYIGRVNGTSLAADIGSFNCYIATYNGIGNSEDIMLFRNGVKIDSANNESGSYTAMENKDSKVGNYYTDTASAKAGIGSYKVGYIAIIGEALSPNQIFDIDNLTREFAKQTALTYKLLPSANLYPSSKLYPKG